MPQAGYFTYHNTNCVDLKLTDYIYNLAMQKSVKQVTSIIFLKTSLHILKPRLGCASENTTLYIKILESKHIVFLIYQSIKLVPKIINLSDHTFFLSTRRSGSYCLFNFYYM